MQRAASLVFTLCLLHGCGGPEDDLYTTEYASVEPQDGDEEADAGVDDEDAGEDDADVGTDTSTETMTWDEICEQWEDIYNDGIDAVCNRILDGKGIPRRGFRRVIAMNICRRKVQQAIDDAVCTIIDIITPDAGEEDADAGEEEEEDSDAGEEEEEETDAGEEEEEDSDAGVPEEEEEPCDEYSYGC